MVYTYVSGHIFFFFLWENICLFFYPAQNKLHSLVLSWNWGGGIQQWFTSDIVLHVKHFPRENHKPQLRHSKNEGLELTSKLIFIFLARLLLYIKAF